jgi:hypothetical protein
MRHALWTSLFLLCIASTAFAQFGIKGGLNSSSYRGSDVGSNITTATNFTAGISYDIGLLLGFSIQPEVLYTRRGGIYDFPSSNYKETDKLDYIDVPLLLKFELPIPILSVYVEGGAAYSFLLSAKRKAEWNGASSEGDIKDNITKNDLSLIVGAGVNIFFIEVDARYVSGQKTIDKNGNLNIYNKGFMATVGIRF